LISILLFAGFEWNIYLPPTPRLGLERFLP